MNPPKTERNQEIVKKAKKGWPFRKIARHYGLAVSTVHAIWKRDSVRSLSTD